MSQNESNTETCNHNKSKARDPNQKKVYIPISFFPWNGTQLKGLMDQHRCVGSASYFVEGFPQQKFPVVS